MAVRENAVATPVEPVLVLTRLFDAPVRVICTDDLSDEQASLVQPAHRGIGKTQLLTGLHVAASRCGGDRS
jgi:hypothetical protein